MKRSAIAILGGGLTKDRNGHWHSSGFRGPAPASHLRISACHYLFEQDPSALIIITGGRGYLSKVDEPAPATIMKAELLAMGIPPRSLLIDTKSENTHRQIQKVKAIIRQRTVENVTITSNKYHLGRIRAFISSDDELKKLLVRKNIKLVPAEQIVQRRQPLLRKRIRNLYKSVKMQRIMAMEKQGIRQIENGTYNLFRTAKPTIHR